MSPELTYTLLIVITFFCIISAVFVMVLFFLKSPARWVGAKILTACALLWGLMVWASS